MTRVFLDWNKPFLPALAERLSEHGAGSHLDLSGTIIALPGKRSGRRLIELLVRGRAAFSPPRVVTVGELPELLYQPELPVADALASLLAWHAALRGSGKSIAKILPFPPANDDVIAWLDLAEELSALKSTLASDFVAFDEVATRCSTLPDFPEEDRWNTLAVLHREYLAILKREGLTDIHEARFHAVRAGKISVDREIVLAGVSDLNLVTRKMLNLAGKTAHITVFIHAPESEQDLFDEHGSPIPAQWRDRSLPIEARQIKVVNQSRDESSAVLEALAHNQDRSADEITIGLGDEESADHLVRMLSLAGVPARAPSLCAIEETAPYLLLDGIARLSESRAWSDAAALFRHPDLERSIVKECGARLPRGWLALADTAAAGSPRREIREPFRGKHSEHSEQLARVSAALAKLIALPEKNATLQRMGSLMRDILLRIYKDRAYNQTRESDRRTILSLEAVDSALLALENAREKGPTALSTSFETAFDILSRLLRGRSIPAEGGDSAVELLGWLELALDDAPAMIITGFNEGMISGSVTSDPFLPDSVRSHMDMADNARRFARDKFLLTCIASSRDDVTLIAARRNNENDPLTPSRLLLACEPDLLPERVALFFGEPATVSLPVSLIVSGSSNALVIPPPEPQPLLTELRVTAFRDYIADPYRFYLKHVRRLKSAEESSDEWSRSDFGTIAHAAISRFGEEETRADRSCSDAKKIHARLCDALDEIVREEYGEKLAPAFHIQKQVMKERFRKFAEKQAEVANQGWKIIAVEEELHRTINLEDFSFRIIGHVDRIDRGPAGELRILDYKTGDAGEKPDAKHRRGKKNAKLWVDLQLPLYRFIASDEKYAVKFGGKIELGYVLLCSDLGKIGFEFAAWTDDELQGAEELAKKILHEIREEKFWKPEDAPRYDDGFGAICMDGYIRRNAVIEQVGRIYSPPESKLVRS